VISYARNTTTHVLDTVAETIIRAGTACTSGSLLGRAQTFYDGSNTLGADSQPGCPPRPAPTSRPSRTRPVGTVQTTYADAIIVLAMPTLGGHRPTLPGR
jgi:hypothetical protein